MKLEEMKNKLEEEKIELSLQSARSHLVDANNAGLKNLALDKKGLEEEKLDEDNKRDEKTEFEQSLQCTEEESRRFLKPPSRRGYRNLQDFLP